MTAVIHPWDPAKRRAEVNLPGKTTADVYYSEHGNAYVLVASPEHGAFTYNEQRVAVCSVDDAGACRSAVKPWNVEGALNSEAQGRDPGRVASEEIAAARHFGLVAARTASPAARRRPAGK